MEPHQFHSPSKNGTLLEQTLNPVLDVNHARVNEAEFFGLGFRFSVERAKTRSELLNQHTTSNRVTSTTQDTYYSRLGEDKDSVNSGLAQSISSYLHGLCALIPHHGSLFLVKRRSLARRLSALAHTSSLDTDLTRNTRAPHFTPQHWLELELELILSQMAQKPMLRLLCHMGLH